MNLLMFNLAADQEHVTLGFGLRWIEALSRRYDHVDVVTMFAGRYQLPSNVRVWSVGASADIRNAGVCCAFTRSCGESCAIGRSALCSRT